MVEISVRQEVRGEEVEICSLVMRRDQKVRCLYVPTVGKPASSQAITFCGICVPILGKDLILVLNAPSVLLEETT